MTSLRQDILPFVVQLLALVLAAILGNVALQQFDLFWLGRFLGIPGLLLIIISLTYSLRKRRIVGWSNHHSLLGLHEILSWLGALLILIHAGTHFNAVLPWLTLVAMVVNVLSGLIGGYLLARSKRQLEAMRSGTSARSRQEEENRHFVDAVAHDLMDQWRIVHYPISIAFAVLAFGHVVSVLLFWEWR